MVLLLNSKHFDYSMWYTHFIIQEYDTFGLFPISDDTAEQ